MSKPRAGRAKATEPKHVVILCHPEPASFNMAVARTYCETVEACGHRAVLRDLYRMAFGHIESRSGASWGRFLTRAKRHANRRSRGRPALRICTACRRVGFESCGYCERCRRCS